MNRRILILLFCGFIIAYSSGCASLGELNLSNEVKMEELYFHGKTGKVFASCSYPVALVADVVLLPITAPVGYCITKYDCHGMALIVIPGFMVQLSSWLVGETITIPIHTLFEYIPRKTKLSFASEEKIEPIIIDLMPYISKNEYMKLLEVTKNSSPPDYASSATWEEPFSFIFGFKPNINKETMDFWK